MPIITHNLTAMNADRQLGIISNGKKKSTEKLSSGYRINRSADDAAGLTISEKMRIQIRGLHKASRNIQDGISLIQTADGALGEIHDLLQRMNELAVQGANDTNADADRDAIQAELDQLKKEINRISKTTRFNTHTVLMAEQLVLIDADDYAAAPMEDTFYGIGNRGSRPVYGKTVDFSNINSSNKERMIGRKFWVTCSQNCRQTFTFEFTDDTSSSADIQGESLYVKIGMKGAINSGADIVSTIYGLAASNQQALISAMNRPNWTNRYNDTIIGHANAVAIDGGKITFYSIADRPPYAPNMGLVRATDLLELEQNYLLQVHDQPYQEIALNLRTINSATLGVGVVDVSSYEGASNTIQNLGNAIKNLSAYRSYLGAMQNRLEKAALVVDNTAENTQSAESRLRDTDMPDETVTFSKTKILEQFGQAVLANSNRNTDIVPQLLA